MATGGLWGSPAPPTRGSLRGSGLFGSLTPVAVPGGLLWQKSSSDRGSTSQHQLSKSRPPASPKPKGRPRGSKDNPHIKRAGHPSARKGISKYSNVNAPPTWFCSETKWNSLDERSRQNEIQRYRIEETGEGVEARRRGERCLKKALSCRFFRSHKLGKSCGECMKVKSSCAGAIRAEDEANLEDHTPLEQPPPHPGPLGGNGHGSGDYEEYPGSMDSIRHHTEPALGAV